MKEIRTFDEVFKAIKKDQKEMKEKKEQGIPLEEEELEELSEQLEDDEEGPMSEDSDEINPIPSDMEDEVDNQDILDEDRQVLNDRVLGIINIFQNVMVQNKVGLTKLPSKHLKALEDLACNALSIEKKDES